MTWFMVYEAATGRALSCGTELADPLPEGMLVADLGEVPPDFGTVAWNTQTRALEPIGSD
ncbi:MAG: hypothetical protein K8U57_07465 [Planctomycetes bacterium]|nr:hypothetical protein [Planctomycetota bacterium]